MPISSSFGLIDRKKTLSTTHVNEASATDKHLLTIGPALPPQHKKVYKRSHSTINTSIKHDNIPRITTLTLQMQSNDIHVSRSQKEKEKYPDRINLDRRGLNIFPILEDEPKLRFEEKSKSSIPPINKSNSADGDLYIFKITNLIFDFLSLLPLCRSVRI
ncbi:hypothetical protein Trydic_g1951 [Trypoxylus dichotomus]